MRLPRWLSWGRALAMGADSAYSNPRLRKNIAPKMRKGSFRCLFLIASRGSDRSRFRLGLLAVLLAEFFHAAGGVHDLLLAGIEGVAGRADFHVQRFAQRGTRSERIAATAGHRDIGVLGMDFRFHFGSLSAWKRDLRFRKGADYPQEFGDWQPQKAVNGDW
jgi:hypothetical protein